MSTPEPTASDLRAYTEAIFDTVRDPLLLLDAKLRVVAANLAFYTTFEVAPEATLGTLLYDLGNGQWDIPRLRLLLEEFLPQRTTVEAFEVEHVFAQIGRRIMLLNARKLLQPVSVTETILLAIEDVTDRVDAERRLRDSEERFRLLIDNAEAYAIFITDPEGRIVTWNKGAERILGWPEEAAVGKPADIIFTDEDRASGLPLRELGVARGGAQAKNERWYQRRDGSRFWATGVMMGVWGAESSFRGYAKILRDLTEQKRYEHAMEEANRELHLRNEEMEQFTHTVSHDLKSPLVTIHGFIGMLEAHLAAGRQEKVAPTIERIRRAAERMNGLIDDLLELSRIGRVRGELADVDVSALVQRIASGLESRMARLGCTLEIDPEMPHVQADGRRLADVFENLLTNAIKYGCGDAGKHVEVGAVSARGELRYYVRDDGPGIAPEYHDRVFGLFQRLQSDQEGSGVGLAIVAKVMGVHGGRAWVESEPGKGATFWIAFPVAVRGKR